MKQSIPIEPQPNPAEEHPVESFTEPSRAPWKNLPQITEAPKSVVDDGTPPEALGQIRKQSGSLRRRDREAVRKASSDENTRLVHEYIRQSPHWAPPRKSYTESKEVISPEGKTETVHT